MQITVSVKDEGLGINPLDSDKIFGLYYHIESDDYNIIKTEAEKKIAVLEAKLSEIPINLMELADVEMILDKAIIKFTDIISIYSNSE